MKNQEIQREALSHWRAPKMTDFEDKLNHLTAQQLAELRRCDIRDAMRIISALPEYPILEGAVIYLGVRQRIESDLSSSLIGGVA